MHAGVPFARLVRERSIGPGRDRGGYLGRMDPANLSPEVRTAVAKTPRGRISPIFRTEDGFAVVQVVTSQEEQELEAQAGRESEAQASLEQGTKLGEGGNLEGAEPLLRRATELNPDLAAAHYNLAIVYRKRQRLDEAIAAMRRVVQLRPDDFEAHLHLGTWLYERRGYPEACEVLERAATLQMDSREAWLGLARSYDAAGRARAAVGAYRRVTGLMDRDDPALYGALLRAAFQAKDGPAAVAAAQKLQPFRPGHEGFLVLGDALVLNGEAGAAIQEYQKAVALAPSSAAAHARLGSAYAQAGQPEKALERFVRAIQLEPQNPAYYRAAAKLYEGQDQLDLAMVTLRDGMRGAAASSPGLQADMAEELSVLYEKAGMAREAEQERLRAKTLRSP